MTIQTTYWVIGHIDEQQRERAIQEAAAMLREGKLVAFPTETVYGLGADARRTEAVEGIFAAKGRPSDNPLIVHIADAAQLDELVLPYGDTARRLMARFWPGPLTLVLPARPGAVSPSVTAGLATVAVRMPAHPDAIALIAAAGCPVAAPSANRSGRPSPTLAAHVRADLDGRIDGIVDGGPTGVGVESTVVAVDGERVTVLRPGGVTLAELRSIAADVALDPALAAQASAPAAAAGAVAPANSDFIPRSPGMKYAHYAPRGELQLVCGASAEAVAARIQAAVDDAKRRGLTTGVLTYAEHAARYRADLVVACGSLADLAAAAHELYAALRRFDDADIGFIAAEGCGDEGIGLAVMNRLTKAAAGRVTYV